MPDNKPVGQTSSHNVNRVEQETEIIRLRRELSMSPKGIATKLGIPPDTVRNTLTAYTESVVAANTKIVADAFAHQVQILEHLLEQAMKQLAHGYSRDIIKDVILILERQAKLLALDKDRSGRLMANDKNWLETAPDAELVEYAERMGCRLPDAFVRPASLPVA